ncbi:MAG TPA: DUF1499 domain-containing protein [Nitrospiria bacterium]|jgi:uncharacterized protein (DUF1499 family)
MFWPVINVVKTGKTPEYPDIQPRSFSLSIEKVFQSAVKTVQSLPRWRVVNTDTAQREIRAEATTRIFRFIDDITIQLQENPKGTVVQVRSASRIGKGDLGQNARNIRLFFRTLGEVAENEINFNK